MTVNDRKPPQKPDYISIFSVLLVLAEVQNHPDRTIWSHGAKRSSEPRNYKQSKHPYLGKHLNRQAAENDEHCHPTRV